jgi:aspartyl aminopeptidase
MPNKPIKQGYKIFALAEYGYIWTFSWSSRQLGIEEMFKQPGLTPTASMVVEIINRLPKISPSIPEHLPPNLPLNLLVNQSNLELTISSPVADYSIYMDNYFNLVALFNYLYDR